MPLNPGNDTVTFTFPGVVTDRLHKTTAVPAKSFVQTGCSMQPLGVKDKISSTAYSEATQECYTLTNTNTLSVEAEWFIQFKGLSYRVLGSRAYRGFTGIPEYISFICKEEKPT